MFWAVHVGAAHRVLSIGRAPFDPAAPRVQNGVYRLGELLCLLGPFPTIASLKSWAVAAWALFTKLRTRAWIVM